jgi:Protein of unknown function (DUF4239)
VNLLLVAVIVAVAVAAGVSLMYAVRRTARADYFLTDTTRGSAIFGVVGTAFAVLLAFVMFVAFQSYTNARDASTAEASAVGRMFRTAEFFDPAQRDELHAELVCYARAVVHQEWPAMADGESSSVVDQWRLDLEDTIRRLDQRTQLEQSGFRQLLAERDVRSETRRDRLTEADPVVSAPVWLILGLGGAATIGFVLLFTDRRESFAVQGALMATVAAMVAASLTLVWFLDHPYEGENGSIEPTEMERTVANMEAEQQGLSPPCTSSGDPRTT